MNSIKFYPTCIRIFGFAFILIMLGCSSKKAVINRDFSIPVDTDNGYIYGKIVHGHMFGKNFRITFKNRISGSPSELNVELYSSDEGYKNFFIELEPGEYLLNQVIPETGVPIDIQKLEKNEHREFFVETGKISYVGSWIFTEGKLEITDEKESQDQYMRINFKYVLTSNAMPSLP